MQAFLISDNHDTRVALRLAGVPGVSAYKAEEMLDAVEEALKMPNLAILVVTESVAATIPDVIQRLREAGELPLVVEIPDRNGPTRGPDFLTGYVRDAIGVKMG